jgi:hypothetical protein
MFFPSNDQGRLGSIVLAIASVFISAQVQGKVYYLSLSEASSLPTDWKYGWDTPANWLEAYERGDSKWQFSGGSPS